jgi:bifunctional oligoribonuclease and PAP phosphatase NrnA
MQEQLAKLIESADKILVTSHTAPDPDALCSALLLGVTLAKNYPDKTINVSLEEKPSRSLDFLPSYQSIKFGALDDQVHEFAPDLLIITDANRYDRCTRLGGNAINKYVNEHKDTLKTVIIDHHEPDDQDHSDLYINQGSPSVTQDVFELCFDQLGLEKPEGYEVIAMLGIIADTARFKYDNPRHRETFKVVSELLDAGASIEQLENRLNQYSLDQMKVLAELANNLTSEGDYSYTFVSDAFAKGWQEQGKAIEDFKVGCEIFTNDFIRNIDSRTWGFVIYQDLSAGWQVYGVSLRSVGPARDVSAIVLKLGGGGHKASAGAKIKADSAEAAIDLVKKAITG